MCACFVCVCVVATTHFGPNAKRNWLANSPNHRFPRAKPTRFCSAFQWRDNNVCMCTYASCAHNPRYTSYVYTASICVMLRCGGDRWQYTTTTTTNRPCSALFYNHPTLLRLPIRHARIAKLVRLNLGYTRASVRAFATTQREHNIMYSMNFTRSHHRRLLLLLSSPLRRSCSQPPKASTSAHARTFFPTAI